MKAFISGMVIGLVLVAAGVYVYFVTGMAPVAAAAEAMPFEKMLAHRALNARIEKEAPRNVPVAADESNFIAGAQVYRDQCAVCHGLPDQQPSAIAKGMFPHPPELFHGKGVTDDEPGETYWKVANGIRLTGMPAFNRSLTETQIWQVSLLVANADKLPDSVMKLLSATQPPGVSVPQPSGTSKPTL